MDEQQKFLDQLEQDIPNGDPFAHLNETPEQGEEQQHEQPEEEPEDDDFLKPRNRREGRLEARLKAERESSIELAARYKAELEANTTRTETRADYLTAVERIYGTETPEAREATEILKTAFQEATANAKREAMEAYEERISQADTAVREAEATLDTMVEDIEDEFDVDFSTPRGEKAKADFYMLLERMSPKDRDGNILYYADHISVWEEYEERLKRAEDPTAKQLSSRSMSQGSTSGDSSLTTDVNERYLREQGII